MWNPIENYRLKRDWRLVSTLDAEYTWTDQNNKKDQIYYYLKENGLGKRKCMHNGTGFASGRGSLAKNQRTSHPMYLKVVRPWLEGQYNPEIPSYESIQAKEFKDALAGKIT